MSGVADAILEALDEHPLLVEVRTAEERYRLYRRRNVRDGPDEPKLILLATAPDIGGVGQALVTIGSEYMAHTGEPHPPVGILDGIDRRWIIGLWEPTT